MGGENPNSCIKQKVNLTSAKIKILILKILSKEVKPIIENMTRKLDGYGKGLQMGCIQLELEIEDSLRSRYSQKMPNCRPAKAQPSMAFFPHMHDRPPGVSESQKIKTLYLFLIAFLNLHQDIIFWRCLRCNNNNNSNNRNIKYRNSQTSNKVR